MVLSPHSNEWYDRLSELYDGYIYPWKSHIPPNNGEDTYLHLVREHISKEKNVLDVGCGHGEVPLMLSPFCKSIIGYDRVSKYIEIAQENLIKEDLDNVKFICANSKIKHNGDITIKIPVEDNSIDVFISRRGPTHWFPEVKRVGKERAVLIELNPIHSPCPEWNNELPKVFRSNYSGKSPNQDFPDEIIEKLGKAGIKMHSYWIFDVPNIFSSIEEYYNCLSWGFIDCKIPSFIECKKTLKSIFKRYGGPEGLDIRFRRFLWKAEYIKLD